MCFSFYLLLTFQQIKKPWWTREYKEASALLTSDDKNAGSMFLYDPKLYPKEHQRYDIDFKKYCCGAAGLCDEYRKRRPSSDCIGYMLQLKVTSCLSALPDTCIGIWLVVGLVAEVVILIVMAIYTPREGSCMKISQ